MFKAWLLEAHRPKTDLAGCACQAGVGQSLAAPLVEQGGKLYQQASYQDGQAHVYASNIPTLGGIVAGTTAEKRSEVARIAAAARWGKRDK
jgi:hypothetical protein